MLNIGEGARGGVYRHGRPDIFCAAKHCILERFLHFHHGEQAFCKSNTPPDVIWICHKSTGPFGTGNFNLYSGPDPVEYLMTLQRILSFQLELEDEHEVV